MTGSKVASANRDLIRFLWRFALIFGLLILPWPGWDELYAQYFRTLGEVAFSRDGNQRLVRFEANPSPADHATLTTRLTLGNRELMGEDGKGRGEIVDLDTRSLGWVPTAMTTALILATPIRWSRRGWALLWGLLVVQGFILFSLQTWIWNQEPGLSLLALPPWLKQVVDDLQYTLVTQLGASFSVPVLVWLLVTFRREDWERFKA